MALLQHVDPARGVYTAPKSSDQQVASHLEYSSHAPQAQVVKLAPENLAQTRPTYPAHSNHFAPGHVGLGDGGESVRNGDGRQGPAERLLQAVQRLLARLHRQRARRPTPCVPRSGQTQKQHAKAQSQCHNPSQSHPRWTFRWPAPVWNRPAPCAPTRCPRRWWPRPGAAPSACAPARGRWPRAAAGRPRACHLRVRSASRYRGDPNVFVPRYREQVTGGSDRHVIGSYLAPCEKGQWGSSTER